MKDNIALDTARVAINMMSLEELRKTIEIAADKIDEKAEQHRVAIEQAIACALEDGFDVTFWVEGANDCSIMCHDDDRNMHVGVN